MRFSPAFSGRVIQVIEALDYGDAVSNQALSLDKMFKEFGLSSEVAARWFHPNVRHNGKHLEEVEPSENDILILHFSGYSANALPFVLDSHATKILYYHNITPHEFFDESAVLHELCKTGREQLRSSVGSFNYFWGDSDFNLRELLELGVREENAQVVPIVIPESTRSGKQVEKIDGVWLFLGRIAPNKGQLELVRAFIKAHEADPTSASQLFLVGNAGDEDPYFLKIKNEIARHNAQDIVTITGKVSDVEKEQLLRRASVYVSFSQHEGFGVPLVEAPLRGIPAVALESSAVGETMGGLGVAKDAKGVARLAIKCVKDRAFGTRLLTQQKENAKRFNHASIREKLCTALEAVVPKFQHYQTVSVVICTYNRRDYLERCLDYLAYQTNAAFEVIVVDGPSTDGTKELLSQWEGRIKIGHNKARNLSCSRNIGVDLADGDIIAYIDDDAIPFSDWVETILNEYNGRPLTTAALGGPAYYAGSLQFQVQDIGLDRFANATPNIDSREIGKNGIYRSLLGTNTTFSRERLATIGGFDEQYDYFLDESDTTFRLQQQCGLIVGYCPNLYVRHEFARSENRTNKHSYNWFSIVKNTTYFVARFSCLSEENLEAYLNDRIQKERVQPLEAAVESGELSVKERDQFVNQIWQGVQQGLKDAARGPLTRQIKPRPGAFMPFPIDSEAPRIGVDLPQLHICIVSKEFPPFGASGGIGTLYSHLTGELLILGHEVTVILPRQEEGRDDQGRFHIKYVRPDEVGFDGTVPANAANLSWSLRAAAAVAEVHQERPVHVVETALWDAEGLAFALIQQGRRPPIVVRLVTPFAVASAMNEWDMPPSATEQFVAAERALISHADAVIAISESVAATVEKEYQLERDDRWKISHCGIAYWPFFDVNTGYAEFTGLETIGSQIQKFGKLVLFVGRLERRKGIDTFLEAVAGILSANSDTCIVIAGKDIEGWTQKSEAIIPAKYKKRVIFAGNVSDLLREKLMAQADCVVFPSRYESFGLVPLEAFVHGVPVIAADAGAIPEVVEDGESGLLFPAEDARILAKTVTRLLQDRDLRERLSHGAKRASRRFSGRNAALESIEIYRSVVR